MSRGGNNHRQRRVLLRRALGDLGYTDAHVQFGWEVSNHAELKRWGDDDDPGNLPHGSPMRLDVVVFYDEREKNWDTTALVAELDRIELVQDKESGRTRAKALFDLTASPCALFAGNGTADLWLKCWQPQPELVGDIPFAEESLRSRFRRHRRDLEREALARLRGGQRYLFDGVYHSRREELVQFLHRGLSKATWLAPQLTSKREQSQYAEERKALSRVAIALMAARILEDKGFFGTTEQTPDAREILHNAESRANGFFQQVISEDLARLDQRLGRQLLNRMLPCLMAHLTGPASFSMVNAEALGFLWETALTAERRRGNDLELNGIHYTPRSIAQHILERIPLEEIRPSERYVLDMASGSGSFLVAATERLRGIFDAREDGCETDVLQHLREHVIGNDTDPIAAVVTRLVYLLEHWTKRSERRNVPEPKHLGTQDALILTRGDFAHTPPSVVVGNPPFGSAGGGEQLANQFLRKSLELLRSGGFLGMVMPGAFLKMRRQKGRETRERLLDACELMEVWEQPLQAVGLTARQETCVVVARKRPARKRELQPVLFKSTYSSTGPAVQVLREDLRSTWTFAATGPPGRPHLSFRRDESARIIASPIDCVWRKPDLNRTLSSLCVIAEGIDAPLSQAAFSPREATGFVPYLRRQRRLKPYFLLPEDWQQDDPDPDHAFVDPTTGLWPKERHWPLYRGPKAIVRGRTNRNSALQLAAAFDERGVFPDHDFRCVALRGRSGDNTDWVNDLLISHESRPLLLWMTAVLNSPVAHAWVATCAPPRGLLEIVLHTLPLPSEYDAEIASLVDQTSALERSVDDESPLWQVRPPDQAGDYLRLAAEINQRILASYGLSRRDSDLLNRFLSGMTDPWVDAPEDAHVPVPGATYRRITGTVVSVDVKRQKLTLDLPRYRRKAGGAVKVPLPKHMPGWALREGAEFTCLAPANRRDPDHLQDAWLLREFRPVPYSYLEPAEIEKMAGFRALEATT